MTNTLYHLLKPRFKKAGNKIALEYLSIDGQRQQFTYSNLLDQIELTKKKLKQFGFLPGDRVALLAENSPEFCIAFLALMSLQITVLLIDTTLTLNDKVGKIQQADVRAIFLSNQQLSQCKQSALVSLPLIMLQADFKLVENTPYPSTLPPSAGGSKNLALMVFTSGTTGQLKTVVHGHFSFINSVLNSSELKMNVDMFCIFPFYHLSGLTLFYMNLYATSRYIFIEKNDIDLIFTVLKEKNPKIFGTPAPFFEVLHTKIAAEMDAKSKLLRTLFYKILSFCGFMQQKLRINLGFLLFYFFRKKISPGLRRFFTGGAPLNPKMHYFFEALGFSVQIGYGLSETCGTVVSNVNTFHKVKSVGKALKGVKIKIYEPDKKGIGEICLQSPTNMLFYLGKTSQQCFTDHWFYSGDSGYLDKTGNLFVTSRIKELIVTRSGKKAIPQEIEQYYKNISGIAELAVVGVPKYEGGFDEIYAALVLDTSNQDVKTHQALQNKIRADIAARSGNIPLQYQIQHCFFINALPKTGGLKKLKRGQLKEIILADRNNKQSKLNENMTSVDSTFVIIADAIAKLSSVPSSKIQLSDYLNSYLNDSLVMLQLTQMLQQRLGKEVVSSAQVLQNKPLSDLAADINNRIALIKSGEHPTRTINDILIPARKIPMPAEEEEALLQPLKSTTILLTGATGVLGSYLTKLILEKTNIKLTCLLLAKTETEGKALIKDLLKIYETDASSLAKLDSQVNVILGNIAEKNLGLPLDIYTQLTQNTDLVIHCASQTSLHGDYDALAATNVRGTKNIIDFTLKTQQKYLLYVSSYSIFGDYLFNKNPPVDEKQFDIGQGFNEIGYQQTKFESELLIRTHKKEGLQWVIVRPGDIFGESQKGSYPLQIPQLKGIFYDLLKTIIDTKVGMESTLYFDVTPVDYVAKAILYFATQHPARFGTYHLNNPDIKPFTEILAGIERCGYVFEKISMDDYYKKINLGQLTINGKPYTSRTVELIRFNPRSIGHASTQVKAYFTQHILHRAGIDCPPIDAELIQKYINYGKKIGYFS